MENQLISFETAQLAKSKGFDLRGCAAYAENGVNSIRTNSDSYTKEKYPINIVTQALLQKWLREKHNVHITVAPNGVGFISGPSRIDGLCFGYRLKKGVGKEWISSDLDEKNLNTSMHSYEEALEVALQESLKLIK